MTQTPPVLPSGTEYVALYHGGPRDGQASRFFVSDGRWDEELTVYVAVDATETRFIYRAESWREIAGEYQVSYRHDPGAGDPVEDLDDRGEY